MKYKSGSLSKKNALDVLNRILGEFLSIHKLFFIFKDKRIISRWWNVVDKDN